MIVELKQSNLDFETERVATHFSGMSFHGHVGLLSQTAYAGPELSLIKKLANLNWYATSLLLNKKIEYDEKEASSHQYNAFL